MITKDDMIDEIINKLNSNTEYLFNELNAMDVLSKYFATKLNQMNKLEIKKMYDKALTYDY